jgi:hypothetical protein
MRTSSEMTRRRSRLRRTRPSHHRGVLSSIAHGARRNWDALFWPRVYALSVGASRPGTALLPAE